MTQEAKKTAARGNKAAGGKRERGQQVRGARKSEGQGGREGGEGSSARPDEDENSQRLGRT